MFTVACTDLLYWGQTRGKHTEMSLRPDKQCCGSGK